MDWLSPLADYGRDKDRIFTEIFNRYDEVLSELLSSIPAQTINFNQLKVGPSAVFAKGKDNGDFEKIRVAFLKKIKLLPGTKLPPKIVHFTIARFKKAIDLAAVERFISSQQLELSQPVKSFRLIREAKAPIVEYEIIKNYFLRR